MTKRPWIVEGDYPVTGGLVAASAPVCHFESYGVAGKMVARCKGRLNFGS